jgi:XRE family aerobic/anaerobic benzoate catabolism transcriptional regulator
MREAPRDQPKDAEGIDFLMRLGDRVKEERARRGMTRKILARDSGVSERYIAQLESGQGNISILLLRELARALDVPLDVLVREGAEPSVDLAHAIAYLRGLDPDDLSEARRLLLARFGGVDAAMRRQRIALIGLRGAGKSTLGRMIAERLDVPFIELDREIERSSGLTLSEIFDLYGQAGFRRLERRSLDRVIESYPRFVLATGGSIVAESTTFSELLLHCYTVWLKARPDEHMARVIAQGDMRPMAENREAMADLERILAGREALYSKADVQVDTGGRTPEESLEILSAALAG